MCKINGLYCALKKATLELFELENVFTACTLLAKNLPMHCITINRCVNVCYATLHCSVMI